MSGKEQKSESENEVAIPVGHRNRKCGPSESMIVSDRRSFPTVTHHRCVEDYLIASANVGHHGGRTIDFPLKKTSQAVLPCMSWFASARSGDFADDNENSGQFSGTNGRQQVCLAKTE